MTDIQEHKSSLEIIERQLENIKQLKPFSYYQVKVIFGEQLVACLIRMLLKMGITAKERYDLPTPRGVLSDGTPVSVYFVELSSLNSGTMCECVTQVDKKFYELWYDYIYILHGEQLINTQFLQFSSTDLLQSLYETVRLEYNRRKRKDR